MSIVSIVVAFGGSIIAIINHKRIRSSCCGRNMVVSLDIEATSPVEIKNPLHNNETKRVQVPSIEIRS